MTIARKHFDSLAEIVRNFDYYFEPTVLRHKLKQELASWCEGHSPNFKRSAFFDECEPREDGS